MSSLEYQRVLATLRARDEYIRVRDTLKSRNAMDERKYHDLLDDPGDRRLLMRWMDADRYEPTQVRKAELDERLRVVRERKRGNIDIDTSGRSELDPPGNRGKAG